MNNVSIEFPQNRMQWFRDARFGMFLHWGLYSLLGKGEWAMNREQIPFSEYEPLAKRFSAENFKPRQWAELARESGMKYMVLTTKHHEGFCLWASKACAFNSVNSAAKRDLLGEYVEAVRATGLKVGLYYSLGDWRNPDWMRGYKGDTEARERFMDWTHELVDELVSNYGKIDIFWYDLPQNFSSEEWRAVELNAKIRAKQPHILINNRAMTTEDFGTPEQHIKVSAVGRMWEACMTMNESWGYTPNDTFWKSPREIIRMLCQCAGGCGNLLLNVGPDGSGRFPEEAVSLLNSVGNWLKLHGEAIYSSTRHKMSWNNWGCPSTARENVLYIPVARWDGSGKLAIGCLTPNILSAEILTTGQKLQFEKEGERTILSGLPKDSPDPMMPVLKLIFDDIPTQHFTRDYGIMDVFPEFP